MKSVSFVIVTYNSGQIIEECLASIANQDYPKDKVEIVLVDGGSKDSTVQIAQRFGAKIIFENTGRPESATGIGVAHANGELICNIASDNVLPHSNWLRLMVQPFDENETIVATYPLRYTYRKSDSLLDRYFALFGVNDPIPYYLNKQDRLSWIEDSWTLAGKAKDFGTFFLVKFDPDHIPTLGANGFVIKKDVLVKADCQPLTFFHIDVNYDLIQMGYNTYGSVKTDIVHQTGYSFVGYLRKRIKYMRVYFVDKSRRRYHVYSSPERQKLLKYLIYSLTFVKPTQDSIRGYKRFSDKAWLLHPIICALTTVIYGFVFVAVSGSKFISSDRKK